MPRHNISSVSTHTPKPGRIINRRPSFVYDYETFIWEAAIWIGLHLAKVDTKGKLAAEVRLNECRHESHFPRRLSRPDEVGGWSHASCKGRGVEIRRL